VTSLGNAEERTRNVSMQSLAIALGATIGPLMVGFSIDHFGHVPTYLYLSLLVIASSGAWIAFRRVIPHPGKTEKKQADGGVRELLALPRLRRIVVVSGLVVAGVDLYTFFMPIYGHSINLTATLIGTVLGAHAAATFVVRTALPTLVRRWGEERVMTSSMYLAGVTFLLFPFVENIALLIPLSFALGLGLGCGQPLSLIMTYNRSPKGRSGEALGLRFTVVNLTHMLIPFAFGSIGSALGLITVFLANSALMFGGGYANARGAAKER
jgi:MFS family permease